MNQLIIKIIVVAASIFLLCSIVFAVQQYGTTSTNNSQNMAEPSHVMSADEFKNRVKSVNQQAKTAAAQQVSEVLPQQQSIPVQNTSNTSNPAVPVMSAPPTPQAAKPVTPPPSAINPAPTAPGTPPPVPSPSTANTTSTVTTAPPSPQNQTYSGFGTGETNKNTNTSTPKSKPSSDTSGGWNIHY